MHLVLIVYIYTLYHTTHNTDIKLTARSTQHKTQTNWIYLFNKSSLKYVLVHFGLLSLMKKFMILTFRLLPGRRSRTRSWSRPGSSTGYQTTPSYTATLTRHNTQNIQNILNGISFY